MFCTIISPRGASGVVIALALLLSALALSSCSGGGERQPTSIIVLVPEDKSDENSEPLALGLAVEMSHRFWVIPGYRVASSRTAAHYHKSPRSARQIGADLGVSYVMTGSVRFKGRQVKMSWRVIDVASGETVWQRQDQPRYRDLSATEADIVASISKELKVKMSTDASNRMNVIATAQHRAYRAYLHGLAIRYTRDESAKSLNDAIIKFNVAARIDGSSPSVYNELALAHGRVIHLGFDASPARAELLRQSLAGTRAEKKDRPATVLLARAYYLFWVKEDRHRAITTLDRAVNSCPSNEEIRMVIADMYRRSGNFLTAHDQLTLAQTLNPSNDLLALDFAELQFGMWQFERGRATLANAIESAPNDTRLHCLRVKSYWMEGDLAGARTALTTIANDETPIVRWTKVCQALMEKDTDTAIRVSTQSQGWSYESDAEFWPSDLIIGLSYERAGEPDKALEYYEDAHEELGRMVSTRPQDFRYGLALAMTFALMGDYDAATQWGESSIDKCPRGLNFWTWSQAQATWIAVLDQTGQSERALIELEELLAFPNPGMSPGYARVSPFLDEIRADPRFDELLTADAQSGVQ